MIIIKHLQIKQISGVNNWWGIDMLLNKPNLYCKRMEYMHLDCYSLNMFWIFDREMKVTYNYE